jgi:hypothetical protein
MNKYTDLTLISMKKGNLLKYIRSLEEIIEKYDASLNKEYKANNNAIEYIKSHTYNETTGKHSYDLTNRETKELLEILKGDKE